MSFWDFFRRKPKVDIHSVSFDNLNWELVEKSNYKMVWRSQEFPAALSLNYFECAPDIPCDLKDIKALRDFYRELVIAKGGGIIQIEVIQVQEKEIVEAILKIPTPSGGKVYFGSYTIPYRDFSYVLKIEAHEDTMAGERDRRIFEQMLNEGKVILSDQNEILGWMEDPYDKTVQEGICKTFAENEQFDAEFPDHPLSRLRSLMKRIKTSIALSKKLGTYQVF